MRDSAVMTKEKILVGNTTKLCLRVFIDRE
jgi:hypothetical protein